MLLVGRMSSEFVDTLECGLEFRVSGMEASKHGASASAIPPQNHTPQF